MLTRQDAAEGANFLTPAIFEVARRRMRTGPGVEPFRCLANMLSSQPMCFNLFGLMVEDTDLATSLLRTVVGDLRRVIEVHIEHAPSPRTEYLGDRTAFDVFVGYERDDGARAFVGIEAKLSEGFGDIAYESDRYLELTRAPDSPWREDQLDTLRTARFNQLWRNHLLVEALRRHPAEPYDSGLFAVVRHPADSDGNRLVAEYQGCLREPGRSFADWPLDMLLERWQAVELDDPTRRWLADFSTRYVELDRSAPAWESVSRNGVSAADGTGGRAQERDAQETASEAAAAT